MDYKIRRVSKGVVDKISSVTTASRGDFHGDFHGDFLAEMRFERAAGAEETWSETKAPVTRASPKRQRCA